jgi:hypothetical protein
VNGQNSPRKPSGPKKAKQQTNKRKSKMKKLRITFGTILLVLGCFALPPAVKAGSPPIVGLWDVYYTSDNFGFLYETYDQWHSDGLEFEVNSIGPGAVCQGTWKQTAGGSVQLFHVGFTYGGAPCPAGNVRFEETQTVTVSLDRNSYDGRYDIKYFDADGNSCEDTGSMHATRLSVQ